MAVYSKILNLINGVARTTDLSVSGNILGISSLELLGSTSGNVQFSAASTTTSYSLIFPSAQGSASTFLQNDGSGNLSWTPISSSPAISNVFVAGQTFAANTSYIVRWGMNTLSETTSRIYAADYSTVSYDEFWAIGIAFSAAGVTAGQNITVYSFGSYTLGSSDTPFSSANIGDPFWLTSSGAFSAIAPTGDSEADLKVGVIMSTTQVWVDGQMMGIGNVSTGAGPNPLPISEGGTGQTTAAAAFAALSPLTTAGDIIYENNTPAPANLPIGTTGQVLTVVAGLPAWQTFSGSGFANTALSNLASTAVNVDLVPGGTTDTINFGSASHVWHNGWIHNLLDQSNEESINTLNRTLNDQNGTTSVNYNAYFLQKTGNTTVDWGNSALVGPTGDDILTWTDNGVYIATPTTGSGGLYLYSNGTNFIQQRATPTGTSYSITWPATQASGTQVLQNNGSGTLSWASASSGTVTSVSVASANGFAGSSSGGATPALTLSTTLTTPVIAGNGTALIAATTTGTGSTVVLSASPTFTGTVTTAALSATTGSFSSAVNMNSNQINNLANGSATGDAVNYGQLQAAISGLYWQGPAKAYAASNVPLTGSTPLVIDGYTVLNGDLLILGNQTTAAQNGEYSAAISGGSYVLTANGLPTAAGDAWLILNGTVYGDSAFVANSAVPTATFTEFAGPTAYTFTAPLSLSGRTVSITQANTSTNGYLSSTDWNTFNGKQAAGSYITALTGDVSASGPGSAAATLATVNSNTGSFGSSTSIPSFTVNGKGLITAASGNAVVAPAGTLSGTTLNSTVVSSSLTSVGTIGTGVWQGTSISPTYGGTGVSNPTAHQIPVAEGSSNFTFISPSTAGNVLTSNGTSSDPSFQAPVTSGIRNINAQTGTTYTFALTDGSGNGNNPLVTFGNSGATTVTVPLNSSVAFPVGTQIDCIQQGAGAVTFSPAGGVTLNSNGGLVIGAQYVGVTLIQTATNTWTIVGYLT